MATTTLTLKIVFGAAFFSEGSSQPNVPAVEEMLQALQQSGVSTLDTAHIYGTSEQLLGETKAASRFTIDTKHPGGFSPGSGTKEKVIAGGEESLKKLQTDKVNIFYLHAPDRGTPLEETLAGINELYEQGKFKYFGISNFRADEVENVIRVAKENQLVLPTVYQGNYNPISRKQETELFPLLRKYGLAFYAYSPLAGGFLTKTVEQLLKGGEGRWDPNTFLGKLYNDMYNKPALLSALENWGQIAKEAGISKAELAYRWMAYHSGLRSDLGDALVIGASSVDQLKQTLHGLHQGPLSDDIAGKVGKVWDEVKDESPLDNFNDWFIKQ
ncbi:hypothetical protein EYZ11_000246 [Aspergillus tanneri]|uniref:Aflatoxin B1 aldehyde reductase member 2 n=1 Tax=Aspergillus tanneri TaxID=1220188 RepID=A0A4S3JXU3_9EURO|nr:Aflatoxin B1 aldehyde reductase member 2 [Aspergillus tanneri]KAA8647760.1 Aflatoxin B1 aldehyde reductase member 2 [Aspergillus tanneri]THD00353.1 hypothetical protein EYZ11_000246 [Aspergillus tanneri]